ncbi:hypothetical protein Fmac_015313 [Flemingia macrophylla]|uniref:Uncharacterized protein n=1 Tax=Flemingia macrophylla TaxID=520843 RepID=A0ABD1MGB2_9FABA
MMSLSLEEFMMWLRDKSAETRNHEGKLDALVNLVTQLVANQKFASIARLCGIYSSNVHHTSKPGRLARSSCELRDSTSYDSKPASLVEESTASVIPMTTILVSVLLRKESGVDEHPEAYAANTYSRPPQSSRAKALDREDDF